MNIREISIARLKEYENNPRHNEWGYRLYPVS